MTDAVIDEVKTWQNRRLAPVYTIMYMDASQFKVRDSGHVRNKAIYLAIGITVSGIKEVLGCGSRRRKAPCVFGDSPSIANS